MLENRLVSEMGYLGAEAVVGQTHVHEAVFERGEARRVRAAIV